MNFTDYFTVGQALPPAIRADLVGFFDRMELRYADIPAGITFTWASVPPSEADSIEFLLDFDLVWHESIAFEDAMSTLDVLRDHERAAFESIIGDKLREAFDAAD